MSEIYDQGCSEYREVSRRQFLRGASGAAMLTLTTEAFLPRIAFAQNPGAPRDILVSLFLRGAADGLTLCVPHGEAAYYAARPQLAIPRPDSHAPDAAADLDGFFGFPPPMQQYLRPAYDAGHLLVVHATGMIGTNRSHFDAQRFMEVAKVSDTSVRQGWLGRHLLSSNPLIPNSFLRAVGLDYGLQQILLGAPKTLPVPVPASFDFTGNPQTLPRRANWIVNAYSRTTDPLRAAAIDTLNTINLLDAIDFKNYRPRGNAVYPATPLGRAMKASAAMIRAEVGVEAYHMDLGGWDTHTSHGIMSSLMTDLARSMGAFYTDIYSGAHPGVTFIVNTEFGRKVEENASHGTDHGHGGVMLLMGEKITGGKVLTQWPGLQRDQLFEGQDVQITTDYRDILAEVVALRLGNTNLPYIFPDYTPTFRGVTRA